MLFLTDHHIQVLFFVVSICRACCFTCRLVGLCTQLASSSEQRSFINKSLSRCITQLDCPKTQSNAHYYNTPYLVFISSHLVGVQLSDISFSTSSLVLLTKSLTTSSSSPLLYESIQYASHIYSVVLTKCLHLLQLPEPMAAINSKDFSLFDNIKHHNNSRSPSPIYTSLTVSLNPYSL